MKRGSASVVLLRLGCTEVYLDLQSTQNHGLYTRCFGLKATVLLRWRSRYCFCLDRQIRAFRPKSFKSKAMTQGLFPHAQSKRVSESTAQSEHVSRLVAFQAEGLSSNPTLVPQIARHVSYLHDLGSTVGIICILSPLGQKPTQDPHGASFRNTLLIA